MVPLLSAVLTLLLLAAPGRAADSAVYHRAVELVESRYLRFDQFDAFEAFDEAAEAAEDAVPWLIVDAEGGVARLYHGESGEFAVVAIGVDEQGRGMTSDLAAALARLQAAVERGPAPVPEDVDLEVELLTGMARALDRHSVVLARRRLERFDERIKGKLTGIGATIGLEGDQLTVKEVFPDSPAELGGLLDGDVILRIDGISTVGMSVAQSVRRIRGPEETVVSLQIKRLEPPGPRVFDIELVRAEVLIPVVEHELRPSGVGVVAIDHFSDHTARFLKEAIDGFATAPTPLRGIVVDLRGNSGGSMIQACRSADLFLDQGIVIKTAGRDGDRVDNLLREYRAHAEEGEPAVPVVVLVDNRSASASEILAGSLMLLDRAVLLGERTHGKGTVQKLFSLRGGDDDSRVRLKLTVAEYLLSGDVPIEPGVGLDPDLVVNRAVFELGGMSLPIAEDGVQPDLVYVDELPGWRELQGVTEADRLADVDGRTIPPEDREDFLVALAERVILDSTGIQRQDVLDGLDRVRAQVEVEEDALLVRTFSYRGLDWRRADEDGPAPPAEVEITVVDPPVAGGETEVRAEVRNTGPAPLYRVRVVLTADDARLPWHGLTLPVGYLPPGAQGLGSAMVKVNPDLPTREDEVRVSLQADRRPARETEPVVLGIEGRPPPPMAVSLRLVPHGDGQRVELTLENLGEQYLTGLHARFALPDDDSVELNDLEAVVNTLRPGGTERADLGIHLVDAAEALDLELRVDAEVYGRVLSLPVSLPLDGTPVRVEPPIVTAAVPRSAPAGEFVLTTRVRDDHEVASVTAWMHGQKVFWKEGDGRRLEVDIPVAIRDGTQGIVVEARDDQGAVTRQTFYVRGLGTGDGAAGVDAPAP